MVKSILVVLFQIWMGLFVISLAYKGVQISHEHLPESLYLVVLALYALALGLGISSIATEKSRRTWTRKIREWLGPRGPLIFPGLLLVTSGAVFASITFVLYEHKLLALTLCEGAPIGVEISDARLLDFYMWHFLKLIPLLSINDVLKWPEPVCYSQSRVGFLILLFQGLVVIPSIAAARFYWKNRHRPE